MLSNKKFFVCVIAAVITIVLMLVLSNSQTSVELAERKKVEANAVPAVQAEQVTDQPAAEASCGTTVSEQNPPLPASHIDLEGLEIDPIVDYYSQRANYMLDNPVHHGRAKLQQQMRNETAEETFINLVDNDNFAMLMPVMGGHLFSPGTYESDIVMVRKMTRVRKLLEDARANPWMVARFLEEQIKTLAAKYPSQCGKHQQPRKENRAGSYYSRELPDYLKTRILCTAAVYVLSQIGASDSWPTLAWLSEQNNSSLPVNHKFLFYAMHNLVQKSPQSSYLGNRDGYLEKARSINIPDARQIKVTAWNAHFHEDDFRRTLPGSKIDLSVQPTIELERFPSLEHLSSGKVKSLLRKLSDT